MKSLHQSNVSSNIRKLYMINLLRSSMIAMPIITLFFQDNGLSLSQIFLLQSVYAIAVFVFEVPTGYFGDRVGTKNSIIIGCIFASIGLTLYAGAKGFWSLAIAEVIIAFGNAFVSGSDDALMYETLKADGRDGEYKLVSGRSNFYGNLSGAIGGIIGGILANHFGFRPVILVEGLIVGLSIPFAFMLKAIRIPSSNPDRSIRINMRKVIKLSLHDHKNLKWLILLTSIISTVTLCMVRATQPYLKQLGIPLLRFGWAWFGLRMLVSISNLYADLFDKVFGLKRGLLILIGLSVAGYTISGFTSLYAHPSWIVVIIGLGGLSLFQIIRGIAGPIASHATHELIDGEIRATVGSVRSMIGRLCYILLGPLIGWRGDLYGLSTMFLLSACLFGVLGLVSFYKLFYRKTQSQTMSIK